MENFKETNVELLKCRTKSTINHLNSSVDGVNCYRTNPKLGIHKKSTLLVSLLRSDSCVLVLSANLTDKRTRSSNELFI